MNQPVVSVNDSDERDPIFCHYHDCHQLIYVKRGSAVITVSGSTYPASAGTLVLISRLETHRIQSKSPDYSRYTVQISPRIHEYSAFLGEKLHSVLVNRPAHFPHAADTSGCPRIAEILREMAEESESGAPMADEMLVFLLSQLLVLFCRLHPELIPENTRNLELIRQVQRHLETNLASKCTLADLAAQFHLSQSHLSHLFKQVTGQSVIACLTSYRIAAAKRCLVESDWPIGKIVEACGFSDNSNFGRTFKAATGLSPTQFRARYANGCKSADG